MFKRRIAVPALVACAAIVAPAGAHAATLQPNKPCYGGGDAILLGGTGYTPNAGIALAANGVALQGTVTANAGGSFIAGLTAPFLTSSTERSDTFTATDAANAANVGTTSVRRSILRVVVKPANASPYTNRRFQARGFTAGPKLYRHITRGKAVSNGSMGTLKGACHTLSVKKRLFRKSAKTGTYRVQFDTSRSYSSKRAQRIRFRVRVYRVARRSSAASAASAPATAQEWTQVK